jgi:hypothetical protein
MIAITAMSDPIASNLQMHTIKADIRDEAETNCAVGQN